MYDDGARIFFTSAWNRLVEVTDNSNVTIARYEYDGLNRRIVKTNELADPDVDYDYFYNESWQIIEVRKDDDTDPVIEMVYHTHYIDAPAYRYYDADTDGTPGYEEFFAFDANFNVTTLANYRPQPQERYEYDAYGQVTILDADFSDDADNVTDYEQDVLFAGYRLDRESGLYEVRNRFLHPSLGRWMQSDPMNYVDGMSLYEYVRSLPTIHLDPAGTAIAYDRDSGRWIGSPMWEHGHTPTFYHDAAAGAATVILSAYLFEDDISYDDKWVELSLTVSARCINGAVAFTALPALGTEVFAAGWISGTKYPGHTTTFPGANAFGGPATSQTVSWVAPLYSEDIWPHWPWVAGGGVGGGIVGGSWLAPVGILGGVLAKHLIGLMADEVFLWTWTSWGVTFTCGLCDGGREMLVVQIGAPPTPTLTHGSTSEPYSVFDAAVQYSGV